MSTDMIPVDVVRPEGEAREAEGWVPPSSRLIRAVSHQIAAMRQELRMGLPVLNKEDLRRYRMYEAGSVLLELLNGGDDQAAQMLWQLLQLDGASRRELDAVEARALRRPPLANCPELLHALAVGLAAGSAAGGAGDRGSGGAQLLQLAEVAWERGVAWWWLTERLLELATEACAGWRRDGGLCEASVALARGTFLLYQLRECGESLPWLTSAAQLAAGQQWAPSPPLLRLLPQSYQEESPEGGLFQVASRALSEALVDEARVARLDQDYGRAAALCREATQRAHDARSPALELRPERELGECLLESGQAAEAADAFRALLALAERLGSPRDVVDAHLKLALCHHRQRDSAATLRSLRDARLKAEELDQPDLLAKAHSHLGEYFLNTTKTRYATTHFHEACQLYSKQTSASSRAEADRVRALAGVAGGLELWGSLVGVLRDSGPAQPAELRRKTLLALAAWKDRRAPFWPDCSRVSQAVERLHRPEPGRSLPVGARRGERDILALTNRFYSET